MSDHHFWLSEAQFARLKPLLPNKVRGVPRVDDRRVISGIIQRGLMWHDAPACYGPHKTLYNRFVRWSKAGVFERIFKALAAENAATAQVSDQRGAWTLLPDLPETNILIGDQGYDGNGFRDALTGRKIKACIPGRANRRKPVDHDRALYKQRNLIEPHVRPAQRLAPHRNTIRPMRTHLFWRHMYRCNRHFLVMSPEPST